MFPETSQNLSCCFVDRKSFSPSVPSLSLSPLLWLPVVPTASEGSSPRSPISLSPSSQRSYPILAFASILPSPLSSDGGFPRYPLLNRRQIPSVPGARARAKGTVARRLVVTGPMGNLSCKETCPLMGQGSTELRTSKEFTIEDAVERLPPPPPPPPRVRKGSCTE